ncbi:hypothetical protein [Roseateles sp. L2-2]|uniref:hypothetical protein n=1 Tax=Roseateles sp. L2-2 TaxID=3422597 RepID=UPI003D36AD12
MSIQLLSQSPLNPLQGLQSPLAGIQQALQGLQQGLQGLTQLLRPLEQLMQNPIQAALSGAGQSIGQAIGQMGQLANSPLGGLGQALGGIGQSLGGIGQALGGLTQGLNALQGGQGGPLAGALGALGGLSQGLNGLNQALGGLGQAAGGLGQAAGGLGGGLGGANQLLGGLSQAIGGLSSALGAAGSLVGAGANGAGGASPLGGSISPQGETGPMDGNRAERALFKAMTDSGMKMISGKELDDAANGICPKGMRPQDFTPEFQQAAKFLRSDAGEKTMKKLDTADADNALSKFGIGLKGKGDDKIGIGDLTASIQKQGLNADQHSTISTLKNNFDALSKDGKTFDLDTMKDVAQGKQMPNGILPSFELQQAAQKFINDTALNKGTDVAQQTSDGKFNQQGDNKYSKSDLEKTLARG